MEPILFCHIPKTAGTSFRKGLETAFGEKYVLYDYGPNSNETSEAVLKSVYEKNDIFLLKGYMRRNMVRALCGHFPASKYTAVFSSERIVTFLRDPINRLSSEYCHFVRHKDYMGRFSDFYGEKFHQNTQSRLLNGYDISQLGFVGVTERYSESLEIINSMFEIEIPNFQLNVAEVNSEHYRLPKAETEYVKNLNSNDYILYENANRLFERRISAFRQRGDLLLGGVKRLTNRKIIGWAYYQHSNKPAHIEIHVDGKLLKRIKCTEYHSDIGCMSNKRCGCVGFTLADKRIYDSNDVHIFDAKSGELITSLLD